jgi:putative oxidoreductase
LLARLRLQRLGDLRHRDPPALDLGLLVLRVAVGVTFFAHGVDKLLDLDATRAFFASVDIPAPAVMAPFVALIETIGGLLLMAGLATPLAGVALAGDMLVAYLTAHIGHGFFVSDGGGELVLLLGAAGLALAGTGPGRYRITDRRAVAGPAR